MAFKKVTNSKNDAMFILNQSDKTRYPVGFEYLVGRTVYSVKEDVTKDAGSEMRRIVTSDGSVEIMTLESMDLDLKEPDALIINDGQSKVEEVVPEPVQEEVAPEPVQDNTDKVEEKGEYDGLDW